MQEPHSSDNSFLTHSNGKAKKTNVPQIDGAIEAQPALDKEMEESSLSSKMAKISSIRESHRSDSARELSPDTSGTTSALPKIMAKVHLGLKEQDLREQLKEKEKEKKGESVPKVDESSHLKMGDPDPGPLKSFFSFLFLYGRFAKGALLMQPLQVTLFFWMICGLGSIQWSVAMLNPVAGPRKTYTSDFASQVLAGGMLLGMGSYLLISMAALVWMRIKFGGLGKFFGLKIVVNAFLLMAAVQLLTLIYGTIVLGEPFWRGQLPPGSDLLYDWVIPLLCMICGYRIAQAITGVFSMNFRSRLALKFGCLLLSAFPLLLIHSGLTDLFRKQTHTQLQLVKSGVDQGVGKDFDAFEQRLSFYDVERKTDLYLLRIEDAYRENRMIDARADALRLDRLAIKGSAEDELAQGLNYLFNNYMDLAVSKLEKALTLNPDLLPAHKWLALALVGRDLEKAEHHAGILMQDLPNVAHLRLMMRILTLQNDYQGIWDAMLIADSPPSEWDPLTLQQGAVAAEALGKTERARFLYRLADEGPAESEPE